MLVNLHHPKTQKYVGNGVLSLFFVAGKNVFRTKEIEITISNKEDEIHNDLNVVLTNKYAGYEKEQRRKIVSMILIGVGIALNIIIPFL